MLAKMRDKLPILARAPRPEAPSPEELELQKQGLSVPLLTTRQFAEHADLAKLRPRRDSFQDRCLPSRRQAPWDHYQHQCRGTPTEGFSRISV